MNMIKRAIKVIKNYQINLHSWCVPLSVCWSRRNWISKVIILINLINLININCNNSFIAKRNNFWICTFLHFRQWWLAYWRVFISFGGILTISREMRRQTLQQASSTDNRQGRANDQTWLANGNMWCGSLVETPRE